MKAIGYQQPSTLDQADALVDIELPMPEPQPRDLLVKVSAVSVNPVDTKVRANMAPEPGQYKVLGWDAVGEVVKVGAQCRHYEVGDKVFYAGDLMRQGTNAQFHLVDERIVGKKPESIDDSAAASVPLTALTAWEMLFDRLQIDQVETPSQSDKVRLLIVGAAGGVGSLLTPLAAKLTDATVIGTASRPESQAWVKSLGADHVIDHSKPLFEELKRIGIDSVTHVISLTHTAQHFDQLVEALAPQGKLALIDDPGAGLDIMKLKMKSISLHWEFMYTRSMFATDDMARQRDILNEVADLIDQQVITPAVNQNFGTINATNLKAAHAAIEGNKTIGKVVLSGF